MESKFKVDKDFYIKVEEYYFVLYQKSTEKRWIKKYLHQCLRVYLEQNVVDSKEPEKGLDTVDKLRLKLEDFITNFTKYLGNYYVKDGKLHDNNKQ